MARPWYLAPSLVRLRAQVNTRWPDRSKVSDGTIGDRAHAARTSDHNPDPKTGVVRALDLTATGSMAATICAAAVADPRVAYVIHNKRIWTPRRGWDTYTGTNPHSNHVHISIAHTKAAEDDTKNWKGIGMAGMTSPAQGRVSSEYGRRAPIPGVTSGTFHAGIDIANKVGTPVYAAFAGTVVGAGTNGVPGRSGKYILIQNPDGERQYYGHLNKIRVKAGQKVKQGQRIGDMGATGNVTGPHLHFEIWRNSSHTSHRNPRIDFNHFGIAPGSKPKATSSAPKPKPAPKPAKGKSSAAVLKRQRDLNRYAKAGLVEDGIRGPVMKAWDKWVRQAQGHLNKFRSSRKKLIKDGHYGPVMAAYVRDVQSRNRLHVDGMLGPVMIRWMRSHGSKISNRPKNRP